jgi:hypothetical protein
MKSLRTFIPNWLLICILILVGLFCVVALWQIAFTLDIGKGDFYGYWSGAYLLAHHQNPYDPALMLSVQQTQAQSELDYAIMAWNPPTLLAFILPLGFMTFASAKATLLVFNIILVLATSMILARWYLPQNNSKVVLIFLLFAMTFPHVLVGFAMGQITFLVLFGLVASLALFKKKQWFWAGAVLILTTVKPHLVVLPVIYLLLIATKQQRYQTWLGLITAGVVCAITLFVFRPLLIPDLLGLLKIAPIHWATPTIGGFLSFLRIAEFPRYLIILLIPCPFWLAQHEKTFSLEFSIALLTLITVPTTFFGWSYDQSMLLIPIAQVFGWISASKNKTLNYGLVVVIGLSLIINYYQRAFTSIIDVYYLWVPLFWWLIFGLIWRRLPASTPATA